MNFTFFELQIKGLHTESHSIKLKLMGKYQNQGSDCTLWENDLGKAIFVEKGHAEMRSSYHVISEVMIIMQCPLVV